MSHFTVLVIGKDWEKQLEPFWELDLSEDEAINDKRAVFVDTSDSYKQEYENGSTEKVEMPDGRLLFPWDDEFRIPGKFGIGTHTHKVPENLKTRNVPHKEAYPTFENFVEKWYGRDIRKNGKYGYYMNPNAKWDWYLMGGRWTGFFKLKNNKLVIDNSDYISELSEKYNVPKEKLIELEEVLRENPSKVYDLRIPDSYSIQKDLEERIKLKYENATVGSPGLMTKLPELGWVDQAIKKDIDFETMKNDEVSKHEKEYDKFHEVLKGRELPMLDNLFIKNNSDRQKTITEYNDHEVIKDLRKNHFHYDYEGFIKPKEDYLEEIRNSAITTCAVIKDGKWYERGEMGWWGISTNEKDEDDWNKEFNELINSLPDDTLLTLVDCHI